MKHKVILSLALSIFLSSCTASLQKMTIKEEMNPKKWKNVFGLVDKNNNWYEFTKEGTVLSQGVVKGYLTNPDREGTLATISIHDIKRIFIKTTGIAGGFLDLISGVGIFAYGISFPFSLPALLPAILISGAATLF